ncbi:MAG: type II secretion system secretin GspD [Thermodesulfobacteriota bacterium]|nr:type II secretion system secretin GspD [Thermodesulfobacteriota bacterium]
MKDMKNYLILTISYIFFITSPVYGEEFKGSSPFSINFDNVKIEEVIETISQLIGFNYILDQGIQGSVTIRCKGAIKPEDIFPLFETMLEMNNLAAVKSGNLYKIVPIKEAQKKSIYPKTGRVKKEIPDADRVIIQIVPLKSIQASEMSKVLKPFVSDMAEINEYPKTNTLIMIELASNLKRLLEIIDIFDVDTFTRMNIKIFPVKYVDTSKLADEAKNILGAMGIGTESAISGGINILPFPRLNFVLAISQNENLLKEAEKWIERLDIESKAQNLERKIFVYPVENSNAKILAETLNKVFVKEVQEGKIIPEEEGKKGEKIGAKAEGAIESTLRGEVNIVADETTNSLIVKATPRDYGIVKDVLKSLDIIPRQVLIEVIIAEITLDDSNQFGVEWQLGEMHIGEMMGDMAGNYGLVQKAAELGGFSFSILENDADFSAFMHALTEYSKLNVISTPHIIACDNKEARIDVGSEVPIITSELTGIGAEGDVKQEIQYRTTGTILSVRPHINSLGLVTMELNQEVSEAQATQTGLTQTPTILKRQVSTTLVCQDGQTIVIGGIIQDKIDSNISGIPYISKIPLLGKVFSSSKNAVKRVELLLTLTPYVIKNKEEADLVTKKFKEKVIRLEKSIKEP